MRYRHLQRFATVLRGAGRAVRRFAGLKLTGPLPDESATLNLRHLVEKRNLGQGLMEEINTRLESQVLKPR